MGWVMTSGVWRTCFSGWASAPRVGAAFWVRLTMGRRLRLTYQRATNPMSRRVAGHKMMRRGRNVSSASTVSLLGTAIARYICVFPSKGDDGHSKTPVVLSKTFETLTLKNQRRMYSFRSLPCRFFEDRRTCPEASSSSNTRRRFKLEYVCLWD